MSICQSSVFIHCDVTFATLTIQSLCLIISDAVITQLLGRLNLILIKTESKLHYGEQNTVSTNNPDAKPTLDIVANQSPQCR